MEQWSRLVDTLHDLIAWTGVKAEVVRGGTNQPTLASSDLPTLRRQLTDVKVVRDEVELKRPLVERSLDAGRLYLRDDSTDDKGLSQDGHEGGCQGFWR